MRVAKTADDVASGVWVVDLAREHLGPAAVNAILSPDEIARADRFLRPADRRRFLGSHLAVRLVLGRALGIDPADLDFAAGPNGKPELKPCGRDRLDFNLSHSGDFALIGVSRQGAIGVDVEVARPIADTLRVAHAHFAPSEIQTLEGCTSEALPGAFFACWTCKEAFVKATGAGLSMRLDRFAVTIPPAPARVVSIDGDATAGRTWSLHRLAPAPGHVGAVAIAAPDTACEVLHLEPGWARARW